MALFRNKKQDDEKIAGVMAEVNRATALAQQSTAKFESEVGMDVQSLLAGAADAMKGGGMEAMTAYRNRAARVYQRGVEMPATLRSVAVGQHAPMLGGIPVQLQLTVEPPGRPPYDVSTDQVMDGSLAATLAAGQRVTVKVDPDDPQCLMIWGTAEAPPAAAAPAPAGDQAERLAKLQDLRAMGVLTDEEFEAQRAKILND